MREKLILWWFNISALTLSRELLKDLRNSIVLTTTIFQKLTRQGERENITNKHEHVASLLQRSFRSSRESVSARTKREKCHEKNITNSDNIYMHFFCNFLCK